MLKQIKYELKQNKQYLFISSFITFFTILPQLLMTPTLNHALAIILLSVFLILISKSSKIVFFSFIIYVNIITIIQSNIAIHWGKYTGDISSRISVSLQSPTYERVEYLKEFVDYRDYLVILYILFILFILFKFVLNYKYKHKVMKKTSLILSILILLILQNQEPLKVVKYYFKTAQMNHAIQDRTNYLSNLKENIKPTNISNLYDKIIVIVGEAANKHHLNIYGYKSDTTPFLSKLSASQQLYSFNAISPTNQTRYSVPANFTDADVSDWYSKYSNSESIITDFKNNGYKTHWISNQGMSGMHEDSILNIALESDTQKFLQNNQTTSVTDIAIKNYLHQQKLCAEKELYIIHLIGSHANYKERYMKEYSLYKNPKNIIQEYDNSIYFTDYIIKNITQYFERDNKKILLVYVSDHGEVVNIHKNGHGFLPSFKDEYEVPLVVYSSIKNKRLEEMFDENKKHYFNTENLNYFIKYISGISNNKNISYSSKVFSLDPKNILDYDKLKFYK